MKRIITTILAIAFVSGVLTGCSGGGNVTDNSGSAANKEPVKFNVGYLASTGHILYFIAQEKGYFRENGLDVELFLFTNSGEGVNAIIAGRLDAGSFGTSPPLTFIAKGADLTIFGGQMTEGHALVAKPEIAAQIKGVASLKGKTISTVRLATGDIALRSALHNAGINWKTDVTIHEMDSPASVLETVKSGSADMGVVWTPYRKMSEDQGLKIVFYSGDLNNLADHPCCRQIALTEKINQDPQKYGRFMRAMIQAYDFYKSRQDESIDILAKYVKVDRNILIAETYGPHISSSPDPNREGVVKFWKAMIAADYIAEGDIDIDKHINTSVFENALNLALNDRPDNVNYKELKEYFKK